MLRASVLYLLLLFFEYACYQQVFAFTASSRTRPACRVETTLLKSAVVAEFVDDSQVEPKKRFMYMTEEQDKDLKELGDHEASLMGKSTPLKEHKAKGVGGSGGFANAKPNFKAQAKAHSKVLRKEGIVRIDNVFTAAIADELKEYLVDLRARGIAGIENGEILDSQERFADVLLNQNRCDLKIPLGPAPVNDAMRHVLSKTCIRSLIELVFDSYGGGGGGSEATLYELNCFMSNAGARRQLVHADNACVEQQVGLKPAEPIMLTCFVSLQDIDETMGPTTWIPGTHNVEAHRKFYETDLDDAATDTSSSSSSKDILLQTTQSVVGTLPKGACAIFDPRVLHCAGANTCSDPDLTRALFYFSFKNPRVDYPGCPSCSGYGIFNAELTMQEFCDELSASAEGKPGQRLESVVCFP